MLEMLKRDRDTTGRPERRCPGPPERHDGAMKEIAMLRRKGEMQKLELIQLPKELPLEARELEEIFARAGAEIIQPLRMDPVAVKDGKVLAFWVEV